MKPYDTQEDLANEKCFASFKQYPQAHLRPDSTPLCVLMYVGICLTLSHKSRAIVVIPPAALGTNRSFSGTNSSQHSQDAPRVIIRKVCKGNGCLRLRREPHSPYMYKQNRWVQRLGASPAKCSCGYWYLFISNYTRAS